MKLHPETLFTELRSIAEPSILDLDLERSSRAFYGINFETASCDATFVDLDARSGWLAIRFALLRPRASVLAVQANTSTRHRISELLQKFDIQNVRLVATFQEANDIICHVKPASVIVRFEMCSSVRELDSVSGWNIDLVCGQFDGERMDSSEICRLSERCFDSFHWVSTNGNIVSGTRSRQPEISIIVPVYNVAPYLNQCIESIISQSLQRIEGLLVNDGSTDGSGDMCDKWVSADDRVRAIHKMNGGCASARMMGLEEATGKYVMFVDADDWLKPRALERLYESAIAQGADIAQGGWTRVDRSGRTQHPSRTELQNAFPVYLRYMATDKEPVILGTPTVWRRIYRRSFLADHSVKFPIEFRRFDDLPFQFHSVHAANRIAVTPFDVYNYRLGRDGQDVSIDDDRLFIHFKILAYMRTLAANLADRNLMKTFFSIQLGTHFWGLSKIRSDKKREYFRRMAADFFGSHQAYSKYKLLFRFLRTRPDIRALIVRAFLTYCISIRSKEVLHEGD